MNILKPQNKNGFTIIEVILVLAIAGLIFLMVFLALPALQRNQRDTQRKNNLAIIADAYSRFKANNPKENINGVHGSYEKNTYNTFAKIVKEYVNIDGYEMKDPGGRPYIEDGRFVGPSLLLDHYFTYHTGNEHKLWEGIRTFENGGTKFTNSIGFVTEARCGEDEIFIRSGKNNAALYVGLEGGGLYCVDV